MNNLKVYVVNRNKLLSGVFTQQKHIWDAIIQISQNPCFDAYAYQKKFKNKIVKGSQLSTVLKGNTRVILLNNENEECFTIQVTNLNTLYEKDK